MYAPALQLRWQVQGRQDRPGSAAGGMICCETNFLRGGRPPTHVRPLMDCVSSHVGQPCGEDGAPGPAPNLGPPLPSPSEEGNGGKHRQLGLAPHLIPVLSRSSAPSENPQTQGEAWALFQAPHFGSSRSAPCSAPCRLSPPSCCKSRGGLLSLWCTHRVCFSGHSPCPS